jgi:hypothetical protein
VPHCPPRGVTPNQPFHLTAARLRLCLNPNGVVGQRQVTGDAGSYTHLCKLLKMLEMLQKTHLNDFKGLRHLCIKMSWRR